MFSAENGSVTQTQESVFIGMPAHKHVFKHIAFGHEVDIEFEVEVVAEFAEQTDARGRQCSAVAAVGMVVEIYGTVNICPCSDSKTIFAVGSAEFCNAVLNVGIHFVLCLGFFGYRHTCGREYTHG